jgi:hypothetical protein
VPINLYFMTHAYFCFYHTLSNICIRRARHVVAKHGVWAKRLATAAVVFLLAYATAYGETLTIAQFPYYTFKVCQHFDSLLRMSIVKPPCFPRCHHLPPEPDNTDSCAMLSGSQCICELLGAVRQIYESEVELESIRHHASGLISSHRICACRIRQGCTPQAPYSMLSTSLSASLCTFKWMRCHAAAGRWVEP